MDDLSKIALETINMKKQALIFCPSRASAEKTAEEISKLVSTHVPELHEQTLHAVSSPTKQCTRLAKCIQKGIAFHHAGLVQKQKSLIEDGFREGRVKIICATPTLCLAKDTQVWNTEGSTKVQDLDDSSDIFVLSQNKIIPMKPKNIVKNHNSMSLIKIKSVSGHSIKLTPNHKVFVKREGKKKIITAGECRTKDKIATIGKLNVNKVSTPQIIDFIIDNSLPIMNRELNKDDFYFIGSMLGDGHSGAEKRDNKIFYKGSPTFTSGDVESTELIELISKNFDPFSKRVKRFGSVSLVLTKKKWFREFLCRLGIDIGIEKRIHPLLVQSNLTNLSELIQGLFDTDGCVQRGRNIAFSNISIGLIKDLQKCLLRFGIVSRIRRRKGRLLNFTGKTYHSKDIYELVIDQNRSILLFEKNINFKLRRKQAALEKLVSKISTVLFSECKKCNYKVYSDVFSGRTREQKLWGNKKKKVINLLGKEQELGSQEIEKRLGFVPRHKGGNRLNHHYEFISKRKIGQISNNEWFWSLNLIGSWIYWKILKQGKNISEFFGLDKCPICKEKLHKNLRKKWRDADFDGDIFWDYVRSVQEVDCENEVYDVVLPNKPQNDHMFVANGFIVHNSAGLSMPAFRVIIKSLKRYSGSWGMDWIPVLEYLQMAGRAGRPEYEKVGESIVIAKNDKEKQEVYEKYVCGEPEDIYSKLAVEPVLRTYLLSLIASGVIRDEKTMNEFFSNTFWAHQFTDMEKLQGIMDKMLRLLEEWEFVIVSGQDDFVSASSMGGKRTMRATMIGKRVSELYLDPLTARHILDCLQKYDESKDEFSLLHMVSHTLEMRPLLRMKASEQDMIQQALVRNYSKLLQEEPSAYDIEYNEFLNSIKTTLFFVSWVDEKDENFLFETYGIRPGEIRMKLEAADWLLYAAEELSKLCGFRIPQLRKVRTRVKHGVKEELLALLKLKGIGRVRARKLYTQGIRDIGDVTKADITTLGQIVGKSVAASVKRQVGEDVKEVPKGTRKGQLSLEKYQ